MATRKKTEPEATVSEAMVWVHLTQTHDLPGMKLLPGRVRVSPTLREELRAAGKIAE